MNEIAAEMIIKEMQRTNREKNLCSQSHKTHRWKADSMLYFMITFLTVLSNVFIVVALREI
jgi:hypothetical protein